MSLTNKLYQIKQNITFILKTWFLSLAEISSTGEHRYIFTSKNYYDTDYNWSFLLTSHNTSIFNLFIFFKCHTLHTYHREVKHTSISH